tara:strand:- start:6896 stop:8179 length:1284 start_codon:yes stop_codon:yes gene_type:complete
MREDFLHFVWKYKKLQVEELRTSKNEIIEVVSGGTHNHFSGPDFFNAQIKINDQLWVGTVEIHLNSSDWYAHGHELDSNYENVILHVVWEDDVAIFRKNNTQIATLELKNYISRGLIDAYQNLFDAKGQKFINCEKDIFKIDTFLVKNWMDRLFFERLERKSNTVSELLTQSKNDWEQVLFILLLKNFGLKINADSFYSIAQNLNFSVVRKIIGNGQQLESLFYGLAGFLEDDKILDTYFLQLKKEYHFLKYKYNLNAHGVQKPEFFKLRPPNFPTIRLSQIANLYVANQNLFSKIIAAVTLTELYFILNVAASTYWDNHFVFGKISKKSTKKLTRKFINLLIINTILPMKFFHAKSLGKNIEEEIIKIISEIKKEENSIINNFTSAGIKISNAMESQSLLQLYNGYCSKNKCLQCAIGNSLLEGNN